MPLVPTRLVTYENKQTGEKRQVVEVIQMNAWPQPCKTCKKEPRRNGSAYCQKCADEFKKESEKLST